MKKTAIFKFMTLMVAISLLTFSCKEDEPKPVTGEALFSYVADGLTVTFTNTSTVSGTVTYAWDFGDSETSTEKNPVHTYASKGEYTVKLAVKDETGKNHTVETKVTVDRKALVSMTDNTASDWDAVTGDNFVVTLGDESGVVQALKFDYDADYLYFMVKFEGALIDSSILNVMIDTDVDTTTGFYTWVWNEMGVDMLMQGQVSLGENASFDVFNHIGEDHGWGWDPLELQAGYYVLGGAYEDGGSVTYEIGLSREKIAALGVDQLKIGVYIADKTWHEIGFAPDASSEGNPQSGFILNMN